MSIPTGTSITTLDFSYGEPFCQLAAKSAIVLGSLDYSYGGEPFAANPTGGGGGGGGPGPGGSAQAQYIIAT